MLAIADLTLRRRLDASLARFNTPEFIATDPVCVPHGFTLKEDIEISALLAATLAWGQRKSILASANRLMVLLDQAPYDFVMHHSAADLRRLKSFVHRTFNGTDAVSLIRALHKVYYSDGGIEAVVSGAVEPDAPDLRQGIAALHEALTCAPGFALRTHKHVADIRQGSAAKRLNLFLRWMVRRDDAGVDFGLWTALSPAQLICPLDVHSGRVARSLGLLRRPANDFRAALELTESLRQLDPEDPVKYDLALFGLGVSGAIS